jgi:cytochrome c oxidase assembly protein subunit 15
MRLNRNWILLWLYCGLFGTLLLVAVGGITRLTDSGLSITEWDVIMGIIPPLNHDEWLAAYKEYQQYPQFNLTQTAASLPDFKFIFFWEYIHRLLGRILGLVLIIPLAFFQVKKWLTTKQLIAFGILILLGFSQAVMGWYMVKSGLINQPNVSHFRLAGHLGLALVIVGYLFLLIQTLRYPQKNSYSITFVVILGLVSFLVFVQSIWGAFVAGLDAGLVYNTYPKMNHSWIPNFSDSVLSFLTRHVSGVQFFHRLLGHSILIFSVLLWILNAAKSRENNERNPISPLLITLGVQVVLGITVLLYHVPILLAVIHQLVAFFIWLICLNLLHQQFYKHDHQILKLTTHQ